MAKFNHKNLFMHSTLAGKLEDGKGFADVVNSIIIAKLLCLYIFIDEKSTLLNPEILPLVCKLIVIHETL